MRPCLVQTMAPSKTSFSPYCDLHARHLIPHHSAYFLFPVTNNLADPKPVLVSAPISKGQQPRTLPVSVVNSTALLYLHTLGKLVLITQVV